MEKKNHDAKFQLRMPKLVRNDVKRVSEEKSTGLLKWSMNDEFLRRVDQARYVPEDIALACKEMGNVKDRLDFAVRLLRQAGIDVTLVKAKKTTS